MVKRYPSFPYIALIGATLFVAASLFMPWPAPAATVDPAWDREFHSVIVTAENISALKMHDVPAVVALREVGDIKTHQFAIRVPHLLAPEYAESLKTDALNFIETRMRC